MKKLFLLFFLIVSVSFTACATTPRYTVDEIKDFPPSVQENIKNGEITPGMTRIQVRYSWGGPDIVTVLAPGEGGKERVEWLYKKKFVFRTRLIFTNDRLTEIISSEPGAIK